MRSAFSLPIAVIMLSAILTGIASAQAVPASALAQNTLQQIVVTATKRPEKEQDVPISMTVMQARDIQQNHIVTIADLARNTPDVGFTASGSVGGSGPGLGNIEIRGVSSTAGQATTGLYYDDVPIIVQNVYTIGAAEPKFFDIKQIEVLRGPQGTLYGASSMGGTIRIDSNAPNTTATNGNAYTQMSETDGGGFNYQANGILNLALIRNKLAVRFGAESGHTDGWINRYALTIDQNGNPHAGPLQAKNINTDSWQVAKITALWRLSGKLSIRPDFFYQRETTGDTNTSSLFMPPNEIAKNTPEPGVDTLGLGALTVKYRFSAARLTSVTGYFYRNFSRTQDGQATNSEYIASLTSAVTPVFDTALANLPSPIALSNKIGQLTEELRVASNPYVSGGTPITWIAGLYYLRQHFRFIDSETIPGIDSLFREHGYTFDVNLPNYSAPGVIATNANYYFPNNFDFLAIRHYLETQEAIFGEVHYHITPRLQLILGGRYLWAKQSVNVLQNYFFGPGPYAQSGSVNSHAFTPKYAVTYEITPHDTAYATVSKGFRLGGNNRVPPVTFCGRSPSTYSPDYLWNYEVGNKGMYLGGHLSLEESLYYIDWKNIQQEIALACGYVTQVNAGNAQSYGAELSIKALLWRGFRVGLAGSVDHADMTSATGILAEPAPNGGAVHQGDLIGGVPDYNLTFNVEQSFSVTRLWDGFARADIDFVGSSHGSVSQYEIGSTELNPDYRRPSYHTVNATMGLENGDWQITLFATNLFNEQKIIQQLNVQYAFEAYRLTPRTVGIGVRYRF